MAEAVISARSGLLDFSPARRRDTNKENDVPVLSLIQFSKPPFVTFGTVKLGTSKLAVLQIDNPTEDVEAEVTVEKIPSSKGFSVDHNTFTVQPEGSFTLTISWTPAEEGGLREIIVFNTNGIIKHQAVLLGRAEAPKKKKKSLWDTIKTKKGEKTAVLSTKKAGPPLKMAANKTFQVARKPQYKRDKPRSPLASLNDGRAAGERSLTKHSPIDSLCQKVLDHKQSCQFQDSSIQESGHHLQKDSPVVLLIPASTFRGSDNVSSSQDTQAEKPENRGLIKMLNRTLSPIGTPESFKKLMPHVLSESPLLATVSSAGADFDSILTKTPVLSVKDALALIDSDLSNPKTSPQDMSSSCEFSDSLESKSERHECGSETEVLKAVSPELSQSGDQRLTFFVSKNVAPSKDEQVTERVKKPSFTSATVTKSRAPVVENSFSGRKIKKSRRRLLEKTLELSDGSSLCESEPGTPSLPVIDADAMASLCDGERHFPGMASSVLAPRPHASPAPIAFSPPSCMAPSHSSPSATSSPSVPPSVTFAISSPATVASSSPLCCNPSSDSVSEQHPAVSAPLTQEDLFPVYMAAKSKKRKSEEFLCGGKAEDAGKPEQVKRSRVVAGRAEAQRSFQERSKTQRQRAAGSKRSVTTSVKTARAAVPAPVKRPSSKAPSQGASSVRASRGRSVKISKVVAVAQSKLTFIKPTQTALPRHPMPFAAKNMFYDERWIEKQERGFTWWINYVLTPDDFKVNTEVAKVNAASIAMGSDDKFSVPKAPTKEEVSFSTYTARRKLNRLRRSACDLFTSEAMVKAIQRLELEVEARRLLVRKDRHLWKDIGERKKVLNWLLSYNPLWLRIGLETIFGELISLESNSDALGLAMFILQRLLWNPDIAAEFRHARVPNLYKDGHEEALSRFTLKKLLLLVCFLDRAKESRLIEHDPCLFCVDAEFKASKDLLLAFSRDFLSGEGILPRHLAYLGLPVSHVQRPLDEFDFAVNNLAVDLKCGIRLVRVMELLIQDWKLSAKLRLPAISRLQKVHNVDVALQVLSSKGVDLNDEHGSTIDSRDIVDGHREKTLSLLWKIIFAFQVEVILDETQLREEIGFLRRTLRTKRRLASVRADRGIQPTPEKTRTPYEHASTKVTLLMDWARAVCDFYNLKVENFTVTFSDGRLLCYLIHHYHPGLLPQASIRGSTTQTVECSPTGRLELSCLASDSDSSFDALPTGPDSPSLKFKELLENERSNFRLVNTAVAFLGGVPAMINPADMSNTIPNAKVVMSYLSFLCARLLDLRNETRAARIIQDAWRKYRLKKDLQLYKERTKAAVKIQVVVRRFLQKRRAERQNQAAVLIQSVWRGFSARNRLRLETEAGLRALRHQAATVIQAQWRMFSSWRAYHRLRYYTVVVQAQWRMMRAATTYGKILRAATVIQRHARAWTLSRRDRERYLLLRTTAVKLQRAYRRWKDQKEQKENCAAKVIQTAFKKWYKRKVAEQSAAAVRIQSWYRMQLCLHQYQNLKKSALLIQAVYRGHSQRRIFQSLKMQDHAAVVIQSSFRGYTVRKQMVQMRCAAVLIQKWFRASVARDMQRKEFLKMRHAAVAIQAAYRGKASRQSLKKQHNAATLIQVAFRRHAAQQKYLALRKAAALMQRKYRAAVVARKAKKEYDALRSAALILQATWRGRASRRRVEMWHHCATLIQTCYRRHKEQTEYRSKRAAAVVLQRHYRAFVAGKEVREAYLQKKAACVTLQAAFKAMKVRTEQKKKHQAATVIQSEVRMFLCRQRYLLLQSAAVVIQSRYRALLLCRARQSEFRKLKQATIKVQAMFLGSRVRKELKRRQSAATAIQAQFRMYRVRMTYLATKCAAIIIQERYRAKRLMEQQMQHYRAMKWAAVVIQAAYRGHRTRRRVAKMHLAASVIQRRFRTIRARTQFLSLKAAALVCQQRYRASTLARKHHLEYLLKRQAVVCLQATYRGHAVRKQLHKANMAAATIQSHFRKYRQRSSYKRLRWACSVLQERYRANKEMRMEAQAFKAKREAAVVLQSAFRGMKSRRMVQRRRQAARVLQRAFRAHGEHRKYLALKSSVLIIQRRYRATMTAKKERKEYEDMRRAAVVLQAAYRGHQLRKEVTGLHQAATVIQSAFRKHREVVKFRAMLLSAIIIQRRYRALRLQRRDRDKFLKMRRSAVVLQTAFRGHHVRTEVAKMHRAATVIQAHFRRRRQQLVFRRHIWAACVLQQRFRAQTHRKLQVKHYQEVRNAAVVLQSAYRGKKSRQIIQQRHQAARVVQRAYRAHSERQQFLRLKRSAITIQQKYRAAVVARKAKKEYDALRSAALILQATWRGRASRRRVEMWHHCATLIQTCYRRHKEQTEYRSKRAAAVVLQRHYRAFVAGKEVREVYLQKKAACVTLQAAFKAMKVRTEQKKKHQAATVIQSEVRMFLCRQRYLLLQSAAVVIQSRYRALLLCRARQSEFRKLKQATIKVQAMFLGFRVRKELKRRQSAATAIQAQFRMYRVRMTYLATKCAAIIIQERYRAKRLMEQQMQHYRAMKWAAVVIQAAYRGHRTRRRVAKMHLAASVIQRRFRTIRARTQFLSLKAAALVCQQRYRASTLARKHHLEYLLKRQAVVCLQATYRGHAVRKQLHKANMAAATIQSHFRKYRQRSSYKRLRWACSVLQERYRANKEMRMEAQAFKAKREAAVVLQSAFRGMKSRRMVQRRRQAARVLQRAFRAHGEHRKYLALKSSVLIIQRRYRATMTAKKERKEYEDMRRAAVVLQAAYRGHQLRKQVTGLHQAATVIQSAFRKHREVVKFRAMLLSAIIIQRRYRALRLQRRDRDKFLKMRRSAVVLQTAFRGHHVRTEVAKMHRAATVIQAHFRRRRQQLVFRRHIWAACVLQQRFRAQTHRKLQVKHYQEVRNAAVVLQSAYRGKKSRQIIQQRHQAARVVQRAYRAHSERQQFLRLKRSAITIQQKYRAAAAAKAERKNYIQLKQSAVTLQRCWRARQRILQAARSERRLRFTSAVFHHLTAIRIQRALRAHWALESAKRQIHSVITIQRWVRAWQRRRRYLEYRATVVTAQRAVKRWLVRRHQAASVIQLAVRKYLHLQRQKRVEQGLVKAQALWRAHRSRRLNDNPNIVKLRHRLRQVTAGVREEDKLCNRTSSALDYLLRYKHFSYILESLKNLETATRLSPECCERLVHSGATNVIFTLIRCCNRSVPCMDVISFSIQILLNLSKYHMTIEAVYSVENSVETLLDLLQRYREKAGDKVAEKGGGIFTKACFLLALLLQDKRRAQEVMKVPKALDRIRSIYRLTARKHKMDAERSIVKQKMSASVNGSFYVAATPRKSRPAPKFAPDWVLRKDKLKDIVDPLRAIQMVAGTLAIVM